MSSELRFSSIPDSLKPSTTSVAITDGIRVTVSSKYLPDQSAPTQKRYVFAYTIWISNESPNTVQLQNRHWIITDATAKVQEVRGAGVVGAQPILEPGQTFSYTSGCILETPRGIMEGSYEMRRGEEETFEVEIAPFALELPSNLN
jgi:ApaG protein